MVENSKIFKIVVNVYFRLWRIVTSSRLHSLCILDHGRIVTPLDCGFCVAIGLWIHEISEYGVSVTLYPCCIIQTVSTHLVFGNDVISQIVESKVIEKWSNHLYPWG